MADFTGQVAIVTGSARGIGFAVAAELAKRGASVVLVDLKADALAPAAKTLQQRVPGAAVATCAADVANQADCERAAQTRSGAGAGSTCWCRRPASSARRT